MFVRGEGCSAGRFSGLAAAVSSCFVRLGGVFFWGRGGVRWTEPFCAAGSWCLGVWKRAEEGAEVVLGSTVQSAEGVRLGAGAGRTGSGDGEGGYGLRPERDGEVRVGDG